MSTISCYALNDLTYTLSLIRANIENKINIIIIKKIIELFHNATNIDSNDVRKTLRDVPFNDARWNFVKVQNVYVRIVIIRNDDFKDLLLKSLNKLLFLLKNNEFYQAACCADKIHMIPDVVCDARGHLSKRKLKKLFKF